MVFPPPLPPSSPPHNPRYYPLHCIILFCYDITSPYLPFYYDVPTSLLRQYLPYFLFLSPTKPLQTNPFIPTHDIDYLAMVPKSKFYFQAINAHKSRGKKKPEKKKMFISVTAPLTETNHPTSNPEPSNLEPSNLEQVNTWSLTGNTNTGLFLTYLVSFNQVTNSL